MTVISRTAAEPVAVTAPTPGDERRLAVRSRMASGPSPAAAPPSGTPTRAAAPPAQAATQRSSRWRRRRHRRNSSLYARVVAVNATVLLAAMLALTLTPATVSSPVTTREWFILAVGMTGLVIANADRSLTIRDAEGKVTTLRPEQVDEINPSVVSLMSARTTAAPASANARAVANPMPELPPVTSATCPAKS